ncbi:hypothetical protein GPECTOR_64g80 [Gonium pectorale]|uniref:RRM Nup35-type domain-containing protein n=1 Tax=Gonium pectorale TaxID=33097 RepID=A0A150G4B4_GONPE|nr:hypothetical protein GPECTOR_64g80 [Gonium pectorale]|eukprot:KXZ44661.1 hypothetical protein GPECTOR_64g80 [Gonium pectorale]
MDEPGSAARGATPPGRHTPSQPAVAVSPLPPGPSHVAGGAGGLGLEQQQPAYDDVWVTVFGFAPSDVPLVLREFHSCGDIVSWSYGEPSANFIHVQYQSKYGAQRALLRSGEQLSGSLIVGVKPLDARHRERVAALAEGSDLDAGYRPKPVPERPYRVEAAAAGQRVPQPNRSVLTRVYEFVLGM